MIPTQAVLLHTTQAVTNQSFQNNYIYSSCISYYKFWNMILLKHKILNAQILRERDPYIKVFLNDTKYMSLSVLNAVCCLVLEKVPSEGS